MKLLLQFLSNRGCSLRRCSVYGILNNVKTLSDGTSQHPLNRRFSVNLKQQEKEWSTISYRTYTTASEPIQTEKSTKEAINTGNKVRELSYSGSTYDGFSSEEIPGSLDHQNLLYTLKVHATTKNRKLPEIIAICNQLTNENISFSAKNCSDILYYLAMLSLPHTELLQKVCVEFQNKIHEIHSPFPLLSGVVHSLALLRYRDPVLLEHIFLASIKFLEPQNVKSVIPFMKSFALLNFYPDKMENFMTGLENTNFESNFKSSISYLNFVWALVILDIAPAVHVDKILSSKFIKGLENFSTRTLSKLSMFLKLINISSYAETKLKDQVSARFRINAESTWYKDLERNRIKAVSSKQIVDCLTQMLPVRSYETIVHSGTGTMVDAITYFGRDGSPVPKNLSDSVTQLFIIGLEYKDLYLPSLDQPTSLALFHKRTLNRKNIKVVLVPFNVLANLETMKAKVDYLESRIREEIPNYEPL